MELSELQNIVFKKAKEKLQTKHWYKGVCMDNFPTDADIERNGISDSVDSVVMETAMWDSDERY